MKKHIIFLTLGILIAACSSNNSNNGPSAESAEPTQVPKLSKTQQDSAYVRHSSSFGQLIYVPVYSHIYQRDKKQTFNLTTTLSIRNADPYRSIKLTEVSYYDLDGNLVQHFLNEKKQISPLASTSFVVEESDLRGGVGANFLVNWESSHNVNPPVVEAVMISTSQQQGLSFLSEGRVLQEHQDNTKSNEQ